jgi:hypothetical protein
MNDIQVGKRYRFNENVTNLLLEGNKLVGNEVIINEVDAWRGTVEINILGTRHNNLRLPVIVLLNYDCLDPILEPIELTTVDDIANNGNKVLIDRFTQWDNDWIKGIKAVIEYNADTGLIALISNDRLLDGNGDHTNKKYLYSYTYPLHKYDTLFKYLKIYLDDGSTHISKKVIEQSFKHIMTKTLKRDEYNESYTLEDLELNENELGVLNSELSKSLNLEVSLVSPYNTIGECIKTIEKQLNK